MLGKIVDFHRGKIICIPLLCVIFSYKLFTLTISLVKQKKNLLFKTAGVPENMCLFGGDWNYRGIWLASGYISHER